MDTSSLERFALAARHALEDGVAQRLYTLALDDEGRREFPAGSDVVRGRVLSNRERRWRDDLVRAVGEEGLAAFSARMAYTWFNRLLAIRYMEVHGFLPCRMRMFSDAEGAFEPEVLARPFEVEIKGLDPEEVSALVASGDDEALFRCLLLAQVGELAATMPQVFGEVGAAESLTLPDNLLSQGDANAVYLAVRDLPEHPVDAEGEPLESVWWPKDEDGDADPTEILGWLYQFYNAEAKDAFFKSKRKASKDDLPVATQLFTPRWIVRYLVENSLGRLWVQGRPGSPLLEAMPYYIAPEEEPVDVAVASPEDITLLDPAMGSGHMLGYAFELLCAIYREAGYRERDVPALILERNLSGFEVDPRAAQIAAFRLLMLGREHDRRLMSRGVAPRITVFSDVVFPEGSLQMTALEDDPGLLDLLGHLGEVGSLWRSTEAQVGTLRTTLAQLDGDDALEAVVREGVARALSYAEALSDEFDVVVTNPPFMSVSNLDLWMDRWIKCIYLDSKENLYSCFMDRAFTLANSHGYISMITMQGWMFISAFGKIRAKVINTKSIETMAHLGAHAFEAIDGERVNTSAFVIANYGRDNIGTYIRLVDEVGESQKKEALLKASLDSKCDYIFHKNQKQFHRLPGGPIAYWASDSVYQSFDRNIMLADFGQAQVGLITGNGSRFLRRWYELSFDDIEFKNTDWRSPLGKWIPYTKGGTFRRWYGNLSYVVNWENDGWEMKNDNYAGKRCKAHNFNGSQAFKQGITWNSISMTKFHCRYVPTGFMFDAAGPLYQTNSNIEYILAYMSSSVYQYIISMINPTENFPPNYVTGTPLILAESHVDRIKEIVQEQLNISRDDWDAQETSWGFRRNSLVD